MDIGIFWIESDGILEGQGGFGILVVLEEEVTEVKVGAQKIGIFLNGLSIDRKGFLGLVVSLVGPAHIQEFYLIVGV